MIRSSIENNRTTLAASDTDTDSVPSPATAEPSQSPDPKPSRPARKRSRPARRRKRPASQEAADSSPPGTETTPWDPSLFKVEPVPDKVRFHDLPLPEPLMRAIYELGFQYCTPIQAEILPQILEGKDAYGKAQTGTGKSAAFLIAILTRLLRQPLEQPRPSAPRALILAPTRELVMQIQSDAEGLARFTGRRIAVAFGGIDYDKQRRELGGEVDILVATPGRLLDFASQKAVRLNSVEVLVIDEADRLLDMGFIPDVRRIIHQTPSKGERQTMLFSATLTPQINELAAQWTRDPAVVEIEPEQVAAESVEQIVYLTTSEEKLTVLYNLITGKNLERVIVFCNRKDVTRRLQETLQRYGINCGMLSGDVAQHKRMKTLERFKNGQLRVLVATDVAGRGLHIEGISHVVNYNLPQDAEDYVHRIGRTGRAGATGTSVSFADERESFYLPQIEEYMGRKLSCVFPEESMLTPLPPLPPDKSKPSPTRSRGRGSSRTGKRSRRPRRT